MKKVLDAQFIHNNSYEDCTHRLSATSRAFCESHNLGSEWYELTPVFNYDVLGVVTKHNGELLTSDISFVESLRLIYTYHYENLKEIWKELAAKAPKEHKGLKVIMKAFPSEEKLKEMIFKYFREKYTKNIKIFKNGAYFMGFRAPKNQSFPFEKGEGIDNFEEFEKFLIEFYNLKGFSLIEPENSENSPIHIWKNRGIDYLPHLKEVGGFLFAKDSLLKGNLTNTNNNKLLINQAIQNAIEWLDIYELEAGKTLAKRFNLLSEFEEKFKEAERIIKKQAGE